MDYNIYDNKMIFNDTFNKSLDKYYKIMKDNSITHLELGRNFNQPIDNLQISFFQEKKKFINRRNKPWYIKFCYLPNS